MDKDYLYDHALEQFTSTGDCPEIFFFVGQSCTSECNQKNELTRRILFTIMWCVIKAKREEIQTLRMIFENFPNLVKSLNELTVNEELQTMTDQYFEDILEFYQFLAQEEKQSDVLEKLLNNLIVKTQLFIKSYRAQLKPPLLFDIYEDYQRRLKEKLDCSANLTDDEYCSSATAFDNLPGSNLDNTSSIEDAKSVVESLESERNSASLHIDKNISASAGACSTDTNQQVLLNERKDPSKPTEATDTSRSVETAQQCDVIETIETAIDDVQKERDCRDDKSTSTDNSVNAPQGCFSGLDLGTSPNKKKRQKRTFSPLSDAMLLHGVQAYGVGHWKEILKNYKFPSYRNPVHLKDRWRTLLHTDVVSHINGRIKILRQQQADVFQKLTDELNARQERSIPVIRLTPLPKKKSTTRLAAPQPIEHSTPDSSPLPALPDTDSESDKLVNSCKRNSEANSPQSQKSPEGKKKVHKRRRRLWNVEGETLEWKDDSILKPNFTSFKNALQKSPSRSSSRKHRKNEHAQKQGTAS